MEEKNQNQKKNKIREIAEYTILTLTILLSLHLLTKENPPQNKGEITPLQLIRMANSPETNTTQITREEEKRTLARSKNEPEIQRAEKNNTENPKTLILDILPTKNPESKLILVAKPGKKPLLIETKNPKLVELINQKRIAPGMKVEVETQPTQDTETTQTAKKIGATPAKLKKLNVIP